MLYRINCKAISIALAVIEEGRRITTYAAEHWPDGKPHDETFKMTVVAAAIYSLAREQLLTVASNFYSRTGELMPSRQQLPEMFPQLFNATEEDPHESHGPIERPNTETSVPELRPAVETLEAFLDSLGENNAAS